MRRPLSWLGKISCLLPFSVNQVFAGKETNMLIQAWDLFQHRLRAWPYVLALTLKSAIPVQAVTARPWVTHCTSGPRCSHPRSGGPGKEVEARALPRARKIVRAALPASLQSTRLLGS